MSIDQFLIDGEKDIVFKGYARIEEREDRFFCYLGGEFFEKDEPYEPPMTYHMINFPVPTRDIYSVLEDKYRFLLSRDHPDLAEKLFPKK